MDLDLIAGIEEQKRNHNGTEQIHYRRGDGSSAHPAHVVAKQPAGSLAEFPNLEVLHSESLHNAIAAYGLLQNLTQVAEAGLAVFRGTPDLATEFTDRNDDDGQEDGGGKSHFPIQANEDSHENDEAEPLLEEVGEVFGKRNASALHVVDRSGEQPASRIVLKKGDRLTNDFGVDLIAKIGDGGLAYILNLGDTQIFRDGF